MLSYGEQEMGTTILDIVIRWLASYPFAWVSGVVLRLPFTSVLVPLQMCFKDVVFPLLARMRHGLYYNTYLVSTVQNLLKCFATGFDHYS